MSSAYSVGDRPMQRLPTTAQPASPLLRLPAELRNNIYHYMLGGLSRRAQANPGTQFGFAVEVRDIDVQSATWEPHPFLFAILKTCRQASLLPYTLNVFEYPQAQNCRTWIDVLTAQQRDAKLVPWGSAEEHLENVLDADFAIDLQELTGLRRVVIVAYEYGQGDKSIRKGGVKKPEVPKEAFERLKMEMGRIEVDITAEGDVSLRDMNA
ncbi:hypothetical protein HBI47_122670 [Parastagonospora nodorum]|nr:hypothetical protein HBI47_122670 [Parastagonospora nodorum]